MVKNLQKQINNYKIEIKLLINKQKEDLKYYFNFFYQPFCTPWNCVNLFLIYI